MALEGLKQRNALCKICCSFDDETLNRITLDIFQKTRTWVEIRSVYSKLLPEGVAPLNDTNINNHRRHTDPELLATQYLASKGEPTTEQEALSLLFSEKFKGEIDKRRLLLEVYRGRLQNLDTMVTQIEAKKVELKEVEEQFLADPSNMTNRLKKAAVLKELRQLSQEADKMQDSLQQVVLKEMSFEKGLVEGSVTIIQNYVNVFQGHLKGFMDEVIPYILLELFPEDPTKGREVVKAIAQAMDRHLKPAFDESKLLNKGSVEVIQR